MKPIAILLFAVLVAPLKAQFEADPRQKMKEILDQVAKEMTQIDKWLQESSRSSDASKGMARNVEQLNKLLDQAGEAQSKVIKGIDDLLDAAQKMQDQASGSPRPDQSEGEGKPGDGKPEPGNSEGGRQPRHLRPDQMIQPQSQDGEKQGSQEQNDRQEWEKGQNADSAAKPDDPTGKHGADKTKGDWGELPPYLLKHGRGTMPEVPEKYRRYLEAITTEGNKK